MSLNVRRGCTRTRRQALRGSAYRIHDAARSARSHHIKGVVIYHEKDGVYLGSALGLAFFSALDPVGQSEATAFRSRDEAAEHVASWRTGDTANTTDYRFIEVDVTERGSATIDACVKAGLPAWNPEG